MSLSQEDRNNLKELGKQAKESQYPLSPLVNFLRDQNPSFAPLIHTICIKDDGVLDNREAQLVKWSRMFVFSYDQNDLMTCETLMGEGYYSA